MTTQLTIDRNAVRELAAELGLDCTVEAEAGRIVLTLATGEREEFATAEEASEAVRAYAK
jgi:glutamate racemase